MCTGQTTHLIGGSPVHLQAGELLFLNQRASHAIQRAEVGDVAVNFIILPQFFDFAFQNRGHLQPVGPLFAGHTENRQFRDHPSALPHRGPAACAEPGGEHGMEPLNNEPGARRANQMRMALLLLDLLDHHDCIEVQREPGQGSPLVLAALREIEENYRTADLTRLAAELHVSLPYLSAAVHRATGRTFKELLLEKRLSKAAQLLRETRLPVEDIIAAVGYENTSYFYRRFRERFGASPRDYRKGK